MMRLEEAAQATGGEARNGDLRFEGVSIDSRTLRGDALFVALRGEHFDGHDFVATATERGAAAAMVEQAWAHGCECGLPLLVVADTRRALGQLAAAWRQRFTPALIGVTGSNGKTTVKEMIAAIAREQARRDGLDAQRAVLATRGNFNNDVGLPLMLLELREAHRYAVFEMGMNHPGEIARLTQLAQPTVALINNAQRAHLEGLGDLEAVARAKGEILDGLAASGTAVINADDAFAPLWRELAGARQVLDFGLERPAAVRGRARQLKLGSELALQTPQGALDVVLQVPGLHNARNALAATAAALAAGISLAAVAAGLTSFAGVPGRLQCRAAQGGARLIDDSYNANPDSVRAAIDVLAATPGRKILVLGDMGEIGDRAGQFHDEIGGYAKSQGLDQLLALGEHSALAASNFGSGGRHFTSPEALLKALRPELREDTVVLVKGSRFMRMERIVEAIAEETPDAGGASPDPQGGPDAA